MSIYYFITNEKVVQMCRKVCLQMAIDDRPGVAIEVEGRWQTATQIERTVLVIRFSGFRRSRLSRDFLLEHRLVPMTQ